MVCLRHDFIKASGKRIIVHCPLSIIFREDHPQRADGTAPYEGNSVLRMEVGGMRVLRLRLRRAQDDG